MAKTDTLTPALLLLTCPLASTSVHTANDRLRNNAHHYNYPEYRPTYYFERSGSSYHWLVLQTRKLPICWWCKNSCRKRERCIASPDNSADR